MAADAAETGHPAARLAAQAAASAASLENLLVPVPRDRLVHGPWPEDLTAAGRAALLPHLGKALTHLGMCAEAIAAEPEYQGKPRNSLALVGHLLARAAAELGGLQRGAPAVSAAGGQPALSCLDFPDPAIPPIPARSVASRRAAGQATRPAARRTP